MRPRTRFAETLRDKHTAQWRPAGPPPPPSRTGTEVWRLAHVSSLHIHASVPQERSGQNTALEGVLNGAVQSAHSAGPVCHRITGLPTGTRCCKQPTAESHCFHLPPSMPRPPVHLSGCRACFVFTAPGNVVGAFPGVCLKTSPGDEPQTADSFQEPLAHKMKGGVFSKVLSPLLMLSWP